MDDCRASQRRLRVGSQMRARGSTDCVQLGVAESKVGAGGQGVDAKPNCLGGRGGSLAGSSTVQSLPLSDATHTPRGGLAQVGQGT